MNEHPLRIVQGAVCVCVPAAEFDKIIADVEKLEAELATCREAFARQTAQLDGAQNEARHFRNIVHRLDAARKGEGEE